VHAHLSGATEVEVDSVTLDELAESAGITAAGVVKVDRLVTHRFPLERIQEAFAAHRSPESIKVTVVI